MEIELGKKYITSDPEICYIEITAINPLTLPWTATGTVVPFSGSSYTAKFKMDGVAELGANLNLVRKTLLMTTADVGRSVRLFNNDIYVLMRCYTSEPSGGFATSDFNYKKNGVLSDDNSTSMFCIKEFV